MCLTSKLYNNQTLGIFKSLPITHSGSRIGTQSPSSRQVLLKVSPSSNPSSHEKVHVSPGLASPSSPRSQLIEPYSGALMRLHTTTKNPQRFVIVNLSVQMHLKMKQYDIAMMHFGLLIIYLYTLTLFSIDTGAVSPFCNA